MRLRRSFHIFFRFLTADRAIAHLFYLITSICDFGSQVDVCSSGQLRILISPLSRRAGWLLFLRSTIIILVLCLFMVKPKLQLLLSRSIRNCSRSICDVARRVVLSVYLKFGITRPPIETPLFQFSKMYSV